MSIMMLNIFPSCDTCIYIITSKKKYANERTNAATWFFDNVFPRRFLRKLMS